MSIVTQADRLGITENDVTRERLAVNLAGSFQVAPDLLAQPQERRLLSDRRPDAAVPHRLAWQTMNNHSGHGRDRPGDFADPRRRSARMRREPSAAVDLALCGASPPTTSIATTQGRDLGAVASGIDRRSSMQTTHDLPKGATDHRCVVRCETMNTAFTGLILGLLGAIVLIYLLIVVNFQSWVDPAVIVSALPAAFDGHRMDAVRDAHAALGAGTHRRDHVHGRRHRQLGTGHQLLHGIDWPRNSAMRCKSAAEAGATRFRPVIMTALAMIIGIAPMALGHGRRRRTECSARPGRRSAA